MYRPRNRSSAFPSTRAEEQEAKEVQNARAIQVLARVKEKLTGMDFPVKDGKKEGGAQQTPVTTPLTAVPVPQVPHAGEEGMLRVDLQVDRLIREATNLENLCQHYIGWCSFW